MLNTAGDAPPPVPPLGECVPGVRADTQLVAEQRGQRFAGFKARVAPGDGKGARKLSHSGARLTISSEAVEEPVDVGIQPLSEEELPTLGTAMENVTQGPQDGYEFTPTPYEFEGSIEVALPYDQGALQSEGKTPQDVRTYYFDEAQSCWRSLEFVSVDTENKLIISRTDHFTDMVNAVLDAPEGPEQVSFDPTQIKGMQAADPSSAVSQIAPPTANNQGEARVAYPIDVPKGREGVQPSLAVRYSSASENSWLGLGWDLTTPSVTIDTRWGVPRYETGRETETYSMAGEQLTPVAHRGAPRARTADKVFHQRVEGSFSRIVRRGDAPTNYSWEVTDKTGTRWLYGGEGAVLTDDAGNIFSWMLRETRDPNGNTVRYTYALVEDAGVDRGTVRGRALYPKKITYTGRGDAAGPYSVTFVRDRELGEARRPDVMIDARGGFKHVIADRLRRVEVRLNDDLVRRYDLVYTEGAFNKTLLKTIQQYDAAGRLFNSHDFEYFDDIRDPSGQYQAFRRVDWDSPDDNVRNGLVDAVSNGSGESSALNGNSSTSAGGHLYLGFGINPFKTNSAGIKTGFSRSSDEGLLALIDVDGDNLPDKVFKNGGGFAFRKNLSRPGGEPRFADQTTPLRNLPGIYGEKSSSRTVGAEAYPGSVAIQLDYVDTISTTQRYFSDVNSDGITDLVNGDSVLFGRVGPDGAPVYGVASDTPVPIGTGVVDASGLLPDYSADRDRRNASFPLVDSLRRWTAPFDGTVRVSGAVTLATSTAELPAFAKPDGVRVAIQHEDTELWSAAIAANDHEEHAPENVDAIQVRRGQHLYFRVGSVSDGAADQVGWDPQITYTDLPAASDANGQSLTSYSASKDFTLAGRSAKVTASADGTLELTGALTKKAATTDDITIVVTRAGDTVFERQVAAGFTGEVPVDATVPVTKGQEIQWRVKADSPIDVTALDWTPTARYAAGVDERAQVPFTAPYDIDTYPVSDATSPPRPFTVSSSGTLSVTPRLTVAPGTTGQVVFTVKKTGARLAKKTIQLGSDPEAVQVEAEAGDELFFDVTVADPNLLGKVTAASVQVDGTEAAATVNTVAEEGVYGRPYRGWAAVGYNGNDERAAQPIRQGDLDSLDDVKAQLPRDVDVDRDRPGFEADPRVNPPKAVLFSPQPDRRRWGAGEDSFVAAATVASSRLGGQSIGLPTAADLSGVRAVPRMSRSQQISVTAGVGGPVGSLGGSLATGNSTGELDYLDMNADGFPDVVGAGGIQYTEPTGALGGTRGDMRDGNVRSSRNVTGNANAGSPARTIVTGRGQGAPNGTTSANTSTAGNEMPPLGVGGNLGGGSSDGKTELLDINGDGLPDRVFDNGFAALNLGYKFADPEPWPGGLLNNGESSNAGLNIGFNTDFYGFAGGASFNKGDNSSSNTLADVNGDNLADRIFGGSPMRVALNKGNGFADPVPFAGSLSGLNKDSNAKLGAGAYFTIAVGFGFFGIGGYIIINPGADTSTGASRAEQMIRDIDGDGFADHLASTRDNQLTVASNQTGRTNLLKSVDRPMGSSFELDYSRDGNTYDQPGSRWVMTSVKTADGLAGDGADVQHTTFAYSGGKQDRLEREFLGYSTVVTQHRTVGGGIFRTVTADYDTSGHYTRGLATRTVTADAQGRPFIETLNAYALRDVGTGAAGDARSTTATIFPALVRVDQRWYEGQAQPGKQARSDTDYDALGNVIRSVDYGEPGAADDLVTTMGYSDCTDSYIVGLLDESEVRGNGTVMRHKEADIDCDTGNMTQHRAQLANGSTAVTDVTYNDNGTMRTLTAPANDRGQRYTLTYTYEDTTGTYVTSTRDSFGYESTATHNLKFGQVETSTDINNQRMVYRFDDVGRTVAVTSPYDHGAAIPTIAMEYHPEAAIPYAVTRHLDRAADGSVKPDTIDTVTFADGLGRVVQTKKDAAVGGADVMTVSGRAVFDEFGRTVKSYYPVTEPKSPDNLTFNPAFDTVRPTTTTYDVLDRPVRTDMPDQTAGATVYGIANDRDGNTQFETVVTDAKGNAKRTYTNVRQETTAVREPGAKAGDPAIWTSYAYDPLGQITRVTDNLGNNTTSVYDNFGRRTAVTTPDAGRTTTGYDLAGNVVRKVTAKLAASGQAVTYAYDFNRVESIDYPVFNGNDVRYTYGGPGAAANTAGRVSRIQDGAGVTTRQYGPLGEVTSETKTLPGPGPNTKTFTTGYRFDSFNRVLQLTFPDSEVLTYSYDSGGQVVSAAGAKGGFTYPYLRQAQYDKFEQRTRMEMGNGTTTNYSYNAEDRRLAIVNSTLPTGYKFQDLHYDYDDVGNITRLENDTVPPGPDNTPKLGGPSIQTYSYDNLYRLTQAAGEYHPTSSSNKTDAYTYGTSYDTIHNITGKSQHHGIILDTGNEQVQRRTTYTNGYTYSGGRPHAPSTIGPDTLSYDPNGNLIDQVSNLPGNPRRQLIWDEDNRLACVHDTSKNATQPQDPSVCNQPGKPPTVRFLYDDMGTRVVKDGSQKTLYPNQNFTARNETEYKHVFIGTTRIATKRTNPSAFEKDQFFFHTDKLGSSVFGTDGTGRLAEHMNYFPSGETWVDERPSERDPYQFTGKEYDPETGYYYHGARYYDPRASLWKSADPASGNYLEGTPNGGVFTPANLSTYAYGNNSPQNYTDQNGQEWTWSDVGWGVAKGLAYTAVGVAVVAGGAVAIAAAGVVVPAAIVTGAVWTAGAVAVAGTGMQGYEVVTGRSVWSGRQLTDSERAQTAGEMVGGGLGMLGVNRLGKALGEAAEAGTARLAATKFRDPCRNSFTPGTGVALPDGSTKPIEEVKVGDKVLATDPETGATEAKAVTALIVGEGEKNLVKVTVDIDGKAGDRTAFVTATDEHPFWVEDQRRWVEAEDLAPGMRLRTSAGNAVQVTAVKAWTARYQKVHNLTVADLHTYYVLAGKTPVLVHNCEFPNQMPGSLAGELAIAQRLGVTPVKVGTTGFDAAINSGTVKWAVLADGSLVVQPKFVAGQEISHAVLSGGAAVRAAGEAEIAGRAASGYFGLSITNHSGHFRPSAESLQIGIDAFKALGVPFP